MSSGRLLRELEVGAASEQGDHERVEGDPLLRRLPDQVRVKGRGEADLGFSARLGHDMNSSKCATMAESTKWAGGATNTPAPAKELEVPMQAQANTPAIRQQRYEGDAVDLQADGQMVRFSRKDLEVFEVYETHLIAEALDGKQYSISIEEWNRSARDGGES